MQKMNFTTYNKNNNNTIRPQHNVPIQLMNMPRNVNIPAQNIIHPTTNTPNNRLRNIETTTNTVNQVPPTQKKMKWGEPTWFLFHTLAHKVKAEYFLQLKQELLNNIYSICANLPCPTCAAHAMDYMKSINFNTIRTKDDLKKLLFVFHNSVNAKKGFPFFQYSDLDEKYSKANTNNIIHNFFYYYQDKHKSIHMIANDLFRQRQVVILKEWFNNNIQYFEA